METVTSKLPVAVVFRATSQLESKPQNSEVIAAPDVEVLEAAASELEPKQTKPLNSEVIAAPVLVVKEFVENTNTWTPALSGSVGIPGLSKKKKASYWFPDGVSSPTTESVAPRSSALLIVSTLFTHLFCTFADLDVQTNIVVVSSAHEQEYSNFTKIVK
ncbi:hypothetical protein ARALYDRAFT_914687 [Arabidopsis lyrata subsp. lyrata]|uniref:Uncharacterized protein n=1 Tax=Arabidopsis lyrata subsp. lyrata TaxID=81972 RepID=D7MG86_ARALL|nr:hypothetical protein ARALYDRAFT_914687 [Arabidopsis lyrata subsp. lyrata]